MSVQSKLTGHAILRFTQQGDGTCDRCCDDILHNDWAGRVLSGDHSVPWVAGTVLCSRCADALEDKLVSRMTRPQS